MAARDLSLNPKKPFVVAFCHQKGGVGKTSSAVSLGASFVEQGESALLVDLDPSGNLTAGLGFNPNEVDASIADILLNSNNPRSAILHSAYSGLDIIGSNPNLVAASHYFYNKKSYEYMLQNLIQTPEISGYDQVLVDCPPLLDTLTILALTAADLVILPTPCEYFSLQALENVFSLITLIREKTNPQLRYRLLVTMFDRRGKFHLHVLELLKEHYGNAILDTVIGFDTKVRQSQLLGIPVNMHAPKTRAAMQYRLLAEELLTHVQ